MENILLSIFFAIVLAVGLSLVVLLPAFATDVSKEQMNKSSAINAGVKVLNTLPTSTSLSLPRGTHLLKAKKLTAEEVAKHQTESDCWLIVKDKVYDVTNYVQEHPGGESILNNAGGDNTKGFYGPQHPRWAYERIEEYYVGDLVQ